MLETNLIGEFVTVRKDARLVDWLLGIDAEIVAAWPMDNRLRVVLSTDKGFATVWADELELQKGGY